MRDVLKWTALVGLFVLPFVPLLVTGSLFFSFITGKNFAFRIIVEIICAAWALLALIDAQYRPRFSRTYVSLAVFVGVIFLADLFGETPAKSLWSNFERMEGWVTLIHLLLYVTALSAMLNTRKLWTYFFNTILTSAFLTSLVGLGQVMGAVKIAQSGVRIEAWLGNAIYMAAYMLFAVCIALFMLAESKQKWRKALYAGLALLFVFLLIETGTRGTLVGLAGGALAAGVYMALCSRAGVLRKIAVGAVAAVLLAGGLFYLARDTSFITESPILSRIASISLAEGKTRFTIWGIAWEGVKERPILGWGQSNFDYVFDKYYKPSLYAQEAWFDRVHDIVLDWLIAGGFVGFAAYAAVWAAALYAFLGSCRERFSIAERGLLLGLLIGYGIHNVFVFDNLVSYYLFATVLALIHSRTASDTPRVAALHVTDRTVYATAAPIAGIALIFCLYFVNIKHLSAGADIIDAIEVISVANSRQDLPADRHNILLKRGLDEFSSALGRRSFADQEISEQLALYAGQVYASQRATAEIKQAYVQLATDALEKQVALRPAQARTQWFLGNFYRATGQTDKALERLSAAQKLSPSKQSILFDIGTTHILRKEYEMAKQIFREAFELAPEYTVARAHYMAAAIYTDDAALLAELSAPPYEELYYEHDLVLQAYYIIEQYEKMIEILDWRIARRPTDIQLRVSKAAIQRQAGDIAGAVKTLRETAEDFPEFKAQAEQFIKSMQ